MSTPGDPAHHYDMLPPGEFSKLSEAEKYDLYQRAQQGKLNAEYLLKTGLGVRKMDTPQAAFPEFSGPRSDDAA